MIYLSQMTHNEMILFFNQKHVIRHIQIHCKMYRTILRFNLILSLLLYNKLTFCVYMSLKVYLASYMVNPT